MSVPAVTVEDMRQVWLNYSVASDKQAEVTAALARDGFKARRGHQPSLLAVLVGEGTDDSDVADAIIERVTGEPAKRRIPTAGTHHFKPYRGRADG